MVMQAAADFLVGGSNPGAANTAAAPPPASINRDSNRRPKILQPGALPFNRGWMSHKCVSHCLEPSQRKISTPPPTPPSKKMLSTFRA